MHAIPWDVKPMVCADFVAMAKRKELRDANGLLSDVVDDCRNNTVGDLRIGASDEFLAKWSKDKAHEIAKRVARGQSYCSVVELLDVYGFDLPPLDDELGVTEESHLKRLSDAAWWKRKAKKLAWQKQEALAVKLRQVSKMRHCYVSNGTLKRYDGQQRKNDDFLQSTKATNDSGFETTLKELSDAGVANPANRRAELMTRINGFEQCADTLGHVCEFLTMTCPSRFHRMKTIKGKRFVMPNNKWDGSTPVDAQRYLSKTYSRIRAKLNRDGLRMYGFRVAEANHDGCVHWHLLMFMDKSDCKEVRKIFRDYCLQEDGHERGAKKHRFTAKRIVKGKDGKGGAAAYIAKYIAKNIDGKFCNPHKVDMFEGKDLDFYGNDTVSGAERVRAWASCWRVRQFQQIGGASVTAWREIRRGINGGQVPLFAEADIIDIAAAANAADWAAYTMLQGGVFVKRDKQRVRAAYWFKEEQKQVNKYGEKIKAAVQGVVNTLTGESILTKVHTWVIERVSNLFKAKDQEENARANDPPVAPRATLGLV